MSGEGQYYAAKEMLAEAGLHCTEPRLAVLSVLLAAERPLSKKQISERLDERINKVTIYRILAAFCEAQIVHKAFMEGRSAYYEPGHNCGSVQCHPHFTCTSCGDIHCFLGKTLPLVQAEAGFVIQRQQVRLEGLCPDCV